MNNIIKLIFIILVSIYMSGCTPTPIPNVYNTDTLYVYINEKSCNNEAMVNIFKKVFLKKTESFQKNVVILKDKNNLPTDGMLLELDNFIAKRGVRRAIWVDFILTSNKDKQLLIKKQMGARTAFYGYNGLASKLAKSMKNYVVIYSDKEIDPRRIPVIEDNKCAKNCGQIDREYRK